MFVSNLRSVLRTHCSNSRTVTSARSLLRNAHSQMIATRQPDSRSCRVMRLSRSTFALNFAFQKSGRVAGSVV